MSWQAIFAAMLPEHILLTGLIALIVLEIVAVHPRGSLAVSIATVCLAALAALVLNLGGVHADPFPGQYSVLPGTSLAKALVLAFALPVLLFAREERTNVRFYPLLLSSLYGFCLIVSAESFLTLFLGLELMALPVYVLVLLGIRRPDSAEAALKYLVLGGTATALFLMGVALLYGGAGSLSIAAFATALHSTDVMARAAVVLVVAAFFVKAAIVPFHAWAPDAYEGASIPVTAYMATIIKAGVLLAVVRLVGTEPLSRPMVDLLAILPLVSIVWGNLAAMRQTSFRRMIAYSSIAHAGYLFYAFLGAGATRFQGIVFYLVAYGLANLLAFAALPRGGDDVAFDRLDNLKGLFRRRPYAALMIGIAMLSLAGIPPFPGFIAKFLIFRNVMAAGYTTYAVLGLVGSYLGIYFYLRVIQFMFMSADQPAKEPGTVRIALAASVLCLVSIAIFALLPGFVLALL
jgi:NADH-quinone oxidoreductase subunit N